MVACARWIVPAAGVGPIVAGSATGLIFAPVSGMARGSLTISTSRYLTDCHHPRNGNRSLVGKNKSD